MKICSHGWKGFPLFRDCFLFIVKFWAIWYSFYALVLCTWSYSNFLFIRNLNSATLLPCFGLISSVPSGYFRICKGLREITLRSNLRFSLESSLITYPHPPPVSALYAPSELIFISSCFGLRHECLMSIKTIVFNISWKLDVHKSYSGTVLNMLVPHMSFHECKILICHNFFEHMRAACALY